MTLFVNRDSIRSRNDRSEEDTHGADAAPVGGVEGLAKVEGSLSLMFLHASEMWRESARRSSLRLAPENLQFWCLEGGGELTASFFGPSASDVLECFIV